MSSRTGNGTSKKPTGSRPLVRRLFSKDHGSAVENGHQQHASSSSASSIPLLNDVHNYPSKLALQSPEGLKDPNGEYAELRWTDHPYVDSPKSENDGLPVTSPSSPPQAISPDGLSDVNLVSPKPRRAGAHGLGSISILTPPCSKTISPPPTPSKLRWEHLRQHILPGASPPPSIRDVASPAPSFSSFSQLGVPTQRAPAPPKPSRLARFGFRQVVDQARDYADEVPRRFSEEILRACWLVRFGDSKLGRVEKEPSGGSTLYHTFMSSTALSSANSSTSNIVSGAQAKQGLRRPPSMQSLVSTSRSSALSNLQSVIIRFAPTEQPLNLARLVLPHEEEVLSVLLSLFLSNSTARSADDSRRVALEIFETIVRVWRPASAEGELERCLWCCKAATMPASPLRSRLLTVLRLLFSGSEQTFSTPVSLKSMIPALIMLLASLSHSEEDRGDVAPVQDLISRVMRGECGHLDIEDLEQKYGARASKKDTEEALRVAICVESVLRCLEFGSPTSRSWILRNVLQARWSSEQPDSVSPLYAKIQSSKLGLFLRSSFKTLELALTSPTSLVTDASVIWRLVTSRVMPELEAINNGDCFELRQLTARVSLVLLNFEFPEHEEVVRMVHGWMDQASAWRKDVLTEITRSVQSLEWTTVIRTIAMLFANLSEDYSKPISAIVIPQLYERIYAAPPPFPCPSLTQLLENLAELYPQLFFKPLFSCAVSNQEAIVMHRLALLVALAHFMPDFWTRDASMMSIALLTDPGTSMNKLLPPKDGEALPWREARLGQTVIMVELLYQIRTLRGIVRDKPDDLHQSYSSLVKFETEFEARAALLLDAREHVGYIPLSQRLLLVNILLEIRLTTKTLKAAPWLKRVVTWALHEDSPFAPPVTSQNDEEVDFTLDKLVSLYIACEEASRPQVRSTMVLSPSMDRQHSVTSEAGSKEAITSLFSTREKFIRSLRKDVQHATLELLVAVSGLLKREEYLLLGPVMWNRHLDSTDKDFLPLVSFLAMQCAEKASPEFLALIQHDMNSEDTQARKAAVVRLSTLSSWRMQLMALQFITDRAHRRPFKLARPPIAFVPTDVGSAQYVPTEDPEDGINSQGQSLPLDLRRRLSEMGWSDETKQKDLDVERAMTPISLLASNYLDRLATQQEGLSSADSAASVQSAAPSKSGNKLLRRASTTGGTLSSARRRPVFVQPLVPVFLQLAALATDSDFTVASLARQLVLDFMRDDPAILCRSTFELLIGTEEDLKTAVTTLRRLLHLRCILPPGLTHHAFNHLAGFLKYIARETEREGSLRSFACIVPILTNLVHQVSEMSVRALRRAKIEIFLFPSGSLWFTDTAPAGPMFPRSPAFLNPFEGTLSESLAWMTMVRTAQTMLFVDILRRNPQDVHIVRKNLTRLVLPASEMMPSLDDTYAAPISEWRKQSQRPKGTLGRLSLLLARSHLLLVAQLFRCMSRHLSDRSELATHFDGVNRILLCHGNDIGIVGHAVVAYMIASTRFRRMMSSSSAFTLFMPVFLQVYCKAESDVGIRTTIEYGVSRFYAVHENTFIFQTLDVVAYLVQERSDDAKWIARNAFQLLGSLKISLTSTTLDLAGIHDANKDQEHETMLAITAEEKPQLFLGSLKKDGSGGPEKLQSSLPADVFDGKRFRTENLIRMILTVIAHDPTVQRAELFLRLLGYLVPDLYQDSITARSVLREGIIALGNIILLKVAAKAKVPESAQIRPSISGASVEVFSADEKQGLGKPHSPTDVMAMRLDYLAIVAAYSTAGGQLDPISLQRSLELVKVIMRESSVAPGESLGSVLNLLISSVLTRNTGLDKLENRTYLLTFMRDVAMIIRNFGQAIDFSITFQALEELLNDPLYAQDVDFSRIVCGEICPAGLEICDLAASERSLLTLPMRPSFVSVLSRCVGLSHSNIIEEIEKREPSPGFMAGVVLPFTLNLRTCTELGSEAPSNEKTSWTSQEHRRTWVRLVAYVFAACGVSVSRDTLRRSNSGLLADRSAARAEEKRSRSPMPRAEQTVANAAIALIILRVIVVRASDDLTIAFPSIWAQMGGFLSSLLRDGDASFSFEARRDQEVPSVPPSPSAGRSPNLTGSLAPPLSRSKMSIPVDDGRRNSFESLDLGGRSASPHLSGGPGQPGNAPRPRAVDYLAWSLLEFLCLYRNPLFVQLHMFTQEKVWSLEQERLAFERSMNISRTDQNTSFASQAASPARLTRPLSGTAFVKQPSRFSSVSPGGSGRESAFVTPNGSPQLRPIDASASLGANLSNLTLTPPTNLSLYNRFPSPTSASPHSPSSPHRRQLPKLKIIHLGPNYRHSEKLARSFSGSTGGHSGSSNSHSKNEETDLSVRLSLRTAIIHNPRLITKTYRRIRSVQSSLGYGRLLLIPALSAIAGNEDDASIYGNPNDAVDIRAWSKSQALENLVTEFHDLMKEFKDDFFKPDTDFDFVEPPSFSFS